MRKPKLKGVELIKFLVAEFTEGRLTKDAFQYGMNDSSITKSELWVYVVSNTYILIASTNLGKSEEV